MLLSSLPSPLILSMRSRASRYALSRQERRCSARQNAKALASMMPIRGAVEVRGVV